MFGAVDLSTLAPSAQAPTPAGNSAGSASAPAGTTPNGLVVDVTAENFREVVERSAQVPVVMELLSAREPVCAQLHAVLETVAVEYGGRFQLARVDVDTSPELGQALQVRALPTVVAVLAGQPAPLFEGVVDEAQARQVIEQVLQIAAANGVTGVLELNVQAEPAAEPEENETQREARTHIERGDFAAAEAVYDKALVQNPGDGELRVGREQVRLVRRLEGKDPAELLATADANPQDLEAALSGADAALIQGDVDGCLGRVLDAVRIHTGEERETARLRAVSLFELIGGEVPQVARARRTLATLLF